MYILLSRIPQIQLSYHISGKEKKSSYRDATVLIPIFPDAEALL